MHVARPTGRIGLGQTKHDTLDTGGTYAGTRRGHASTTSHTPKCGEREDAMTLDPRYSKGLGASNDATTKQQYENPYFPV